MHAGDRVIAVGATFTAEAIQPGLAFWTAELGLDYEVRFAGYNTLFQQLLDPSGIYASNATGINVALVRFEDWSAAGIDSQIRRFAGVARTAAGILPAPLIVALCPPRQENETAFPAREAILIDAFADIPGIHLIRPCDWESLYICGEKHDPHGDKLGHLPYTPAFFMGLATAIMRKIHAIVTPPYKIVALDCDDTLWEGICGEDGPQGVVLDAPHKALQEFMVSRRQEGMLLVLTSKNNEEDVLETFRLHPEMPLRLEDFAASRINWDSKAGNLESIAAELGLGLDSFILVDDSPKECKEVQAAIPAVLTLALPAEPAEIPDFLKHLWAFDRARVTGEDRRRSELYVQNAERQRAFRSARSLEEFLASLQLDIRIAPLEQASVPRVAQLTQRTNQMNVTMVRRSEPEVLALLNDGAECLTVTVADRFGDYGLTGAVIFRAAAGTLVVDTFLLSCRALGRGVEHRMIARLGEVAVERGLRLVEILFVSGQRNRPAALFLESLRRPDADGVFRFPAEEAAAVTYKVGQPKSAASAAADFETTAAPVAPQADSTTRKRIDYSRIATEWRKPEVILERIRLSRSASPARGSFEPPRTPLEAELAELWTGLLNVPAVGVRDNFFELGGHSLLAVQLLSRIRNTYGVDLSLEVVYSGNFTVAELAGAMELKEMEQAGSGYQDLIEELDGLSDEEVREMLAREQGVP